MPFQSLQRAHQEGQSLLCWLFKGALNVSLGTAKWYRSSCGTDFAAFALASPEGAGHVSEALQSGDLRSGWLQRGMTLGCLQELKAFKIQGPLRP